MIVLRRLLSALATWPDQGGWRHVVVTLLWLIPMLAACAALGGWARFAPERDWGTVLRVAALLLFIPSFAEEVFFRGVLLPAVGEERRKLGIVAAIALFVAWHPLRALTFGPPWAELFLDPRFLVATAVLGIALAQMYLRTGSLWPSVLTHWVVVAVWKLGFGGPFA